MLRRADPMLHVLLVLVHFYEVNAKKLIKDHIHLKLCFLCYCLYQFYRYAEVLLSYVEAQNEASGPDPAVCDAVIRVRAGVLLPAVPAGIGQADLRTLIAMAVTSCWLPFALTLQVAPMYRHVLITVPIHITTSERRCALLTAQEVSKFNLP